MNIVGVTIRSAWKNGYEFRIHVSGLSHGLPSSVSYSTTYWSVPYPAIAFPCPASLTAALNRLSRAMTWSVSMPP